MINSDDINSDLCFVFQSEICVTLRLNKELEGGKVEFIDHCSIEIASPLIKQTLWFEQTMKNERF